MKVIEFNSQKGNYHFELDEVHTSMHAHPVIEIIHATQGTFTIRTSENTYSNLTFAIIDAHVSHALITVDTTLQLLMIERYNTLFYEYLQQLGVSIKDDVFIKKAPYKASLLFDQIVSLSQNNDLKKPRDSRIQTCLDLLDHDLFDYQDMMHTLTSTVHLSESRLSHLFTAQIGISLKKYLIWCRLKKSMSLMIYENINLLEASFRTGFYDQAHLSNAFKKMLGIAPSEKYNSRMIQL